MHPDRDSLDKAIDEVRSWLGDDKATERRFQDEHGPHPIELDADGEVVTETSRDSNLRTGPQKRLEA